MDAFARPSATARAFVIVALLTAAIVINYIDRGNLSIAATLIKAELHLSATQLGFLLSAFFFTYILPQPFVGWLVDRVSAARVALWGFVIWSLATVLSGFAGTFVALVLCRLLLGLGESVSFPSFTKILASYVGEDRRGLATSAVLAGTALGPAFSVFFGGMLVAAFGWRPFFIGFGVISSLWIVAWLSVMPKKQRRTDRSPQAQRPSLKRILREPSLWGASLGQCFSSYTGYFLLTWLPYYLVHERRKLDSVSEEAKCAERLQRPAAHARRPRLTGP
jgi:MFS transporter, ACS family, D-galactonate transporter